MVDETLALLKIWEPGMSIVALKRRALETGTLGRATALRVEDIVGRVFAARFLRGTPPPAQHLKTLLDLGVPWRNLANVLFLHTARTHDVLADFVVQVYWTKFTADATVIARQDALDFLENSAAMGIISPPWSDIVMLRVARYLTGCLTDFGLAGPDRAGIRPLVPFRLDDLTALYLVHDIHFSGVNDTSLVNHPEWRLFGFEARDLPALLKRVCGNHFLPQFAGDLVRITWHYRTFEEALRGIASTKL